MPVETRYGCSNKARSPGYWAPDTRYSLLPPKHVWHWVEDVSSRDCRYDNSLADAKCAGCAQRGEGEKHAAGIQARSAA